MPYIPFTDEQKQRANSVDLVEFLRRRGERLLPSGRDKRLESDHSVTIRGCEWFDHAIPVGGRAISFVQRQYGLSSQEAVKLLLSGEDAAGYPAANKEEKLSPTPFVLPPRNQYIGYRQDGCIMLSAALLLFSNTLPLSLCLSRCGS